MKHGDTCCGLFGLGHLEGAIGEIEAVMLLLHKIWEDFGLEIGASKGF